MSDHTKLAERFYIGSAPGSRGVFDVIVLCAKEYQPSESRFPGATIIRVPLDDFDGPFHQQEIDWIITASEEISRLWKKKKQILVSCVLGRNRSALVSAVALAKIYDKPLDKTAAFVRTRRRDSFGVSALENLYFWGLLTSDCTPFGP